MDELGALCRQNGWELAAVREGKTDEGLEFVRGCAADMGIVVGLHFPRGAWFSVPRLSILQCTLEHIPASDRGSVDGQKAGDKLARVRTVLHLAREGDQQVSRLQSRTFSLQPFDTPQSTALKVDLIAEDLLLAALRDWHPGERPRGEPVPDESAEAEHIPLQPRADFAAFRASRTRPAWKLLLRSTAYAGPLPLRNWRRRQRKRFPLVILCHHLISDRPHPMGLSTDGFLKQLGYLKRHYRLVSLREGIELLESGRIEEPTAALTLDDGYEDNFLCLRTVLRVEPAPVTLFVCSELIEKRQPFPHDVRDRREGFLPLTVAQLQQLAAEGIEIGSHTRTHFNCGSMDGAMLEKEIAGSRQDLERLLGQPVSYFAFPWGKPVNMSAEAREIAARSYAHYFSAYGGVNFPGRTEPHLVRSAHPHDLWELELSLQQMLEFQPAETRSSAAGEKARVGDAGPSRSKAEAPETQPRKAS
jgi:peptidoglycan/xylan/chitin deacetylase (PgdA/CDA1 family)